MDKLVGPIQARTTMTDDMNENRLLLLSGEEAFLQTAPALLKPMGFQVVALDDHRTLLEVLEDRRFDAVVIDADLPELDTRALVATIVQVYPWMVVVVLSSGAFSAPIAKWPEKSTILAVEKPCDPTHVGRIARDAIRTSGMWTPRFSIHNPAPVRVLLVHDDEIMLSRLSDVLSRRSMIVESAMSSMEAVNALDDDDFEVVVIDDEISGLSLTDIILRMTLVSPRTTVLMLVRNASDGLGHGSHGFLVKPYDIEDLVDGIRQAAILTRAYDEQASKPVDDLPGEALN